MKHLVILLLVVCITEVTALRDCPKLYLKNGKVVKNPRGRIARFFCNRDYVLDGYNLSVCLGRHWSHPVPECIHVSNSSLMYNDTTIHPDEINATDTMTTSKIAVTETMIINDTKAKFLSTANSVQNTSKSTITSLLKPTKNTASSQKTPVVKTASLTVTMVTNITMERTFSMVMEKTTLFTNTVTKAIQNKSNRNNYLYIGLTCVAIIGACVVIVIIWYRRRKRTVSRTMDKVQLVSRTVSEEHEEWSLLV